MYADDDAQSDQRNHADRNKKNAEHLHIAAGLCQHRGASVSLTATLRNVTSRDYLGLADSP
jgi:7-keto-8-aminopelargonate synthetase-like enzyme